MSQYFCFVSFACLSSCSTNLQSCHSVGCYITEINKWWEESEEGGGGEVRGREREDVTLIQGHANTSVGKVEVHHILHIACSICPVVQCVQNVGAVTYQVHINKTHNRGKTKRKEDRVDQITCSRRTSNVSPFYIN